MVDDKFKIHIQVDDLLVLLTQEHPKIESFSDSLKEKLSSRLGSMTSAIISCEPNQENYVKQTVFAPVWIGKNSMSLLVDKHECRAIYFRFTGKELLDRQAMVVEKKVAEEEGKKKDDVEVLNQVEMVNKVVA